MSILFKISKPQEKISNFSSLSPKINESTKETTTYNKTIYEKRENVIDLVLRNNPKILEDFEILDFVNSGSVGTFYEGRYRKGSKQKIGIKFFLNETQNTKKIKQKNEEISYLRKLKYKYIIGLFGYLKIDDFDTCAILELAKYGDLEHFQNKILKRKYLPETLICYLAKQILESLDYIHRIKILHSDIKQSNILIDSNLNVKLTDFSVSTSYLENKQEEKIRLPFVGTGKFIPPEILEKSKVLVKDINKVDIYSMGIVLYYLAYGTYPYDLKKVKSKEYDMILETLKSKKELIFLDDRKISNLFADFLKGILQIDINKRLDIKSALKHPWIRGAEIIMNEKEKICNLEKFLVELITDNIVEFNDYISCEDEIKRKKILDNV